MQYERNEKFKIRWGVGYEKEGRDLSCLSWWGLGEKRIHIHVFVLLLQSSCLRCFLERQPMPIFLFLHLSYACTI